MPPDSEVDLKDATFGPAADRHTRVPIKFKKLPKGEQGRFETPSLLDAILNTPSLLTGKPISELPQKGSISLDPTGPDFNLDRDARHEAIHSLLMNQPGSSGIAAAPQIYSQIAQKLMKSRNMANPAQETAAYMGSFDPKQSDVPQDWRDEYIGKLKKGLAQLNPGLAKQFGLLSGSGN